MKKIVTVIIIMTIILLSGISGKGQASELHEAILNMDILKVEELLKNGSNPNEKNLETKEYPTFLAIEVRSLCILKLLIEKGADINQKDESQASLLIHSADLGLIDIMLYLLDSGLDPNHKDMFGRTALMWAALNNKPKAVKVLIENKADINIKDNEEESAISLLEAKSRYNKEPFSETISLVVQAKLGPLKKEISNPAHRSSDGFY